MFIPCVSTKFQLKKCGIAHHAAVAGYGSSTTPALSLFPCHQVETKWHGGALQSSEAELTNVDCI
jgi:hypothetical protein